MYNDAIQVPTKRGHKPNRVCIGCMRSFPAKSKSKRKFVSRHHLVPRGQPDWKDNVGRNGQVKTVPLCWDCHEMVHHAFGNGDCFHGPTTKRHLVRWIQIKLNKS